MRTAWTVAWVIGGALLAASTEAGPLRGFSLAGEAAHVAVYTRDHKAPDPQKIEDRLVRFSTLLGVREVPRADFYYHESAGDVAAVTGRYAGGITYPRLSQIHATGYRADHEIVHLVAYQLGDPGAFFQEGLAVALGDKAKWNGRSVDEVARQLARGVPIATLIARFNPADPQEGYALAGSFVNYLLKRYGIAKVAGFFSACAGCRPGDAFAESFGETLDAAGAAWAAQL